MAKKAKAEEEIKVKPLTGKTLLTKLKEIPKLSRSAKALECGYVSVGKNGDSRVNLSGFINAILEARGVSLDSESGKDGRGKEATYQVSVHKNRQIVIGSVYTEKMGLKTGDEFEIKLGYKHIRLVQIGAESADEKK
jgi:AbrB-like transcriptional regulator